MKPHISFLSKKREAITTDFANWYQNEVFLKLNPSLNRDSWSDNWKIVEHVQEALRRVFKPILSASHVILGKVFSSFDRLNWDGNKFENFAKMLRL